MRKRILVFMLIITTTVSLCACSGNQKNSTEIVKEEASNQTSYENKLFDSSYVHKIDVEIAEDDFDGLLDNPTEKTKYEVNISIDGEVIEDVSFATKGNTSLTSIASDENSDRYSFKINFGKYVDGQNYYGLDRLNLNNIYADATYMKDYLSYQIFAASGIDAPLTSYSLLSINGEAFGLYLAIEDIGESYLARTEDGDGELYKPETEQLANIGEMAGRANQEMPENGEMSKGMPEGMEKPENGEMMNEMPQNGMGSSKNGASLQYTDDEITSYSDIFDNVETDSDEDDWNRVIGALKSL